MSEVQQVDRKDLKIQALLEKISNMTAQYENQIADLRVDLTVVSQELEATKAEAPDTDPEATSEKSKKKD